MKFANKNSSVILSLAKNLIVLSMFFGTAAQARYTTVVSEQVITPEENKPAINERKARSKAIEQATNAVTVDMVKAEIGEARYAENAKKVDDQVRKLKNRFIPFFKILSSTKEGESYRFKIEVKVSKEDLRLVLQQKGLFANSSKTGITLPFIEFNNQMSGESYRWWSEVFSVAKELETLSLQFEKELFQGFLDKGLFMLRPQAFRMVNLVPNFMRKTYLTQTDMVQITNVKNGQLYIDGRVDVVTSPLRVGALRIRVDLKCKQASNGKTVAEVVRTFDTVKGKVMNQLSTEIKTLAQETGTDLASQVYDLWQRGALESETLQLAVTGNLDHHQLVKFKKELAAKIAGSQGLTERLFEPGRVTFEMNYRGGVESLANKLKKTRFEGFMSQVVSSNSQSVTLDVRATE